MTMTKKKTIQPKIKIIDNELNWPDYHLVMATSKVQLIKFFKFVTTYSQFANEPLGPISLGNGWRLYMHSDIFNDYKEDIKRFKLGWFVTKIPIYEEASQMYNELMEK